MKTKYMLIVGVIFSIILLVCSISIIENTKKTVQTTATLEGTISNRKIGWGVKRVPNNAQPDLGAENIKNINTYKGIAIGNSNDKNVYLTFDYGYEAGYTEKILDVLKENDVKATFFITAHYVNSQENLVKRMIDEGHIIGNHIKNTLMYHK